MPGPTRYAIIDSTTKKVLRDGYVAFVAQTGETLLTSGIDIANDWDNRMNPRPGIKDWYWHSSTSTFEETAP